jgi:serine/threonine-protein kinase
MARPLPILVVALPGEQARELEEASHVGRHVWVKLKTPPRAQGPHMLEVHSPESDEPLRLLAEPLGTSSDERGFALRVYPWEEDDVETAPAYPYVSPDAMVGRTLANGRFEILSVVGEGSIGAVYRARHTGLGIIVAVKVLHEAFQRDAAFCSRFYAEALALSRLDHPNLVHIFDFGQEPDGLLYIAMAFVEGTTLRATLLREKKTPELKRAVSIMLQVCAGLGHAHARGLIHRDVKPDNVMITAREDDDGQLVENVKVLDFGFAVPPSVSGEVAQRLAGTPVYMSPEQCLGQELDARSDVYACGIMLYELTTGTVPFLGRNAESIRHKQVHAPPPPISARRPDVDPRLERLVLKALSKRREDRHQNMQELRAELKSLLAPEGASVSSLTTTGSFERASVPSVHSMQAARNAAPVGSRGEPSDWIETSARSHARLLEQARASAAAEAAAAALSTDAASWLGDLARERDRARFASRLMELEGALRILAQREQVRPLQLAAAVLDGLDSRLEAEDEVGRSALARVRRLFSDPDILAPIARRVLGSEEEGREAAAELIAAAGTTGAHALYRARTKEAVEPRARIAFVTTMKSIGEPALPILRAALERVHDAATSGQHAGAPELAEDLLLSVPALPDERIGLLAVKYAASSSARVCRAAARALARVWAQQAQPILLDMVDHEDESVRVAAIVGLREIGGMDENAVARVGALLERGGAQSPQLRNAAIAALQSATGIPAAAALLARLVS